MQSIPPRGLETLQSRILLEEPYNIPVHLTKLNDVSTVIKAFSGALSILNSSSINLLARSAIRCPSCCGAEFAVMGSAWQTSLGLGTSIVILATSDLI